MIADMSYRDINRGPELNQAYEARQAWLKKTAAQKQAAYKTVAKSKTERVKPEKVPAYVQPFLLDKQNIWYETRGLSAAQTGAGSAVSAIARTIAGNRIVYVAPAGAADTIMALRDLW